MSDHGSPAPSTVRHVPIPDDTMILQYASVDPTRVLDNPRHRFGDGSTPPVEPATGAVVEELMALYQKLAHLNATITIQSVKFDLQRNELKSSEVYDLMDKFYMDLPDINCVSTSWLTPETLALIVEKQTLHETIKQHLQTLHSILTDAPKTDSASEVSTEPELAAPRKAGKKAKAKAKK